MSRIDKKAKRIGKGFLEQRVLDYNICKMNRETETDKKRVVTTRIDDFIETNILY